MKDELTTLLDFVLGLLKDYGLDDFFLELSTKNPDKFVGDGRGVGGGDADARRGGGGLGPRVPARPGRRGLLRPQDLGAGARRHRADVADLHHPARLQPARERFELEYTAADGTRQRPVMIHRALFGSIERFFAILDRALRRGVPRVARARPGARHPRRRALQRLPCGCGRAASSRRGCGSNWTTSDERFPKKIRNASKQKVPFVLIAGGEDAEAGAVSFRFRDGTPGKRGARRQGDRAHRRRDRGAGAGLGGRRRGHGDDGRHPGRLRAALDSASHGVRQGRVRSGWAHPRIGVSFLHRGGRRRPCQPRRRAGESTASPSSTSSPTTPATS